MFVEEQSEETDHSDASYISQNMTPHVPDELAHIVFIKRTRGARSLVRRQRIFQSGPERFDGR